MEKLLYDITTLARIIIERDMPFNMSQQFISDIWQYEKEFLSLQYRFNKKQFLLDIMSEVNYWKNKSAYDHEITAVNKDFQSIGSQNRYIATRNYYNLHSYFMEMRLRMIFLDNQDFIRMKLRTLLYDHGYKRRTAGLNRYLKQCMYFYHIQTFVRGGQSCDIEEILLDDMITFRVLGNFRDYVSQSE